MYHIKYLIRQKTHIEPNVKIVKYEKIDPKIISIIRKDYKKIEEESRKFSVY